MRWVAAGAVGCALAVVAGAFGAHGLEGRLGSRELELWETAARYLMYGSLGTALLGLASRVIGRPVAAAGCCLALGSVVFSATVFGLALGSPRWFGAVAPIGGVLMIVGFLLFAIAAWQARDGSRRA